MLGLGLSFAKQTAKVFSYIKDKLKAYYRFYDTQPDFLLDGSTSFDGTDDYIDTGSSFSGVFGDGTTDNGFTITCWVNKPEDSSGLYGVCGKTFSDLAIRLMSNGRVQVFLRDVGGSAYLQREPTSVIGSGWHHLAVTYDGSRTVDGIKIYGDAVAVSGGNGTSGTFNAHANTSNNFQIGNTNGGSYMTGDMACFGVWNRELSASEIESIRWRGAYSELKDTELTNLVSWYDLQGDVLDKQGSNDGTNNGATLNSDSYSGESPFKPRIQDKAHPKMAVQLADGSTSFDGTDDYISMTDTNFPSGSSDRSISIWFSPNTTSTEQNLFHYGTDATGQRISILGNNTSVALGINGCKVGIESLNLANTFTHIVFIIKGHTDDTELYINGSSQSLSVLAGTAQSINTVLNGTAYIGRHYSTAYWNGKVANVSIHSSALTQTQIQELMFTEKYSGLSADLKTNLVSWYDMGSAELGDTDLVTNGTFDNDYTGWTLSGATAEVVNGQLRLTSTNANGRAVQAITFEAYKTYQLTVDNISSPIGGNYAEVKVDHWITDGAESYDSGSDTYARITSGNSLTAIFKSSVSGSKELRLTDGSSGAGSVHVYDNASIKEYYIQDYHSNNNGYPYPGTTINTGYTHSPHGVVDPLNFGEMYSGRALSFDGSNDDATIGDIGATMYAMSFWFESNADISASSGLGHPICLTDDHSYGGIYFGGFTGSLTNEVISIVSNTASKINYYTSATDVIPDDMWHHLGITWDSSNSKYKIYLDGNELPVTESGGTISPIVCDYVMLGKRYSGHHLYAGKLNNIKIFNTALTESQLRELYTKPETVLPTGVSASNLKLDLPMQEGSGSYIYDGSSNQNHGTINGATWESGQEYGYQASLVRSNTPMIFDGSNDVVTIADNATTQDIFDTGGTVQLIYKLDGTSASQLLFSKSANSIYVNMSGSNNIGFRTEHATTNGKWTAPFTNNTEFVHLVITHDKSSVSNNPSIYVNGSALTVTEILTPVGASVSDSGSNLLIGSAPFAGIANEVAMWDKVLDADAVSALYNSGVPLLPTSDSGNYDNSDSLVGYWRNDGNTTWTDRANTGVASFDGINDYIEVSDSNSLSFGNGTTDSAFSFSCWVKADDLTSKVFFSKGVYNTDGEYFFATTSADKLDLFIMDESVASTYQRVQSPAITSYEGQWIHVVATYDGRGGTSANDGMKLYLNGVSQTVTKSSGGTYVAMENLGSNVEIGLYNTTYSEQLMANVNIFNVTLTATEVSELYAIDKRSSISGHSQFSNCVASYLMGAGDGDSTSTIQDQTSNNNDGTVNGASLVGYNDGTASGSPVEILIPEGSTEGRDNQGYYLSDTTTISNGARFHGSEYIKLDVSQTLNFGTTNFSAECWSKKSVLDDFLYLIKWGHSSDPRWYMRHKNDGKLTIAVDDGTTAIGADSSSAVLDNDWHHYAFTFDRTSSTGLKIYIDGSLDSSHDFSSLSSSDLTNNTYSVWIGVSESESAYYMNGLIDEVRIYNKELSADEVTKNYNNGKSSHQ